MPDCRPREADSDELGVRDVAVLVVRDGLRGVVDGTNGRDNDYEAQRPPDPPPDPPNRHGLVTLATWP